MRIQTWRDKIKMMQTIHNKNQSATMKEKAAKTIRVM